MRKRAGRITRRQFVKGASAALAAPMIVPTSVFAGQQQAAPSERLTVGFIGCGKMANDYHLRELLKFGDVQAVAVCEVDTTRRKHAKRRVEDAYAKDGSYRGCAEYSDFRELLARDDVDAVCIATPDHWHAIPIIEACKAGKDVYCEKPLTLTILEAKRCIDAVRKHERVMQTGSQQRSQAQNRFGCELVRNGRIGKIHTVIGHNYPSPWECALPGQPVPEGLDWDMWCGPAEVVPYHVDLYTPRAKPGWISFRPYSGGEMTGWGAHGLDQIQWALGMSRSGPVEIWPITEEPSRKVSMRYANGVEVRYELDQTPMGGAVFVGEECKIEINRNKFTTNPPDFVKNPPQPAVAEIWEGPGWIARPHIQNWLDCIRTRQKPNADVEIGHRSISACHLANIARELGRKLHWDPEKEVFPGDAEANRLLDRPKRKGYELPAV